MDRKDFEALQELDELGRSFMLQRVSPETNLVDVRDKRLREYVYAQIGDEPEAERQPSKVGIRVYTCRVGTGERAFGRTVAEAVTEALRGSEGTPAGIEVNYNRRRVKIAGNYYALDPNSGRILGANAYCHGDNHVGHIHCGAPPAGFREAEERGEIYRDRDVAGWHWFVKREVREGHNGPTEY